MTAGRPRLFNISPDADFLTTLVGAIDSGHLPMPRGRAPAADELARWTILVPNRRAARALGQAFLKVTANGARLLPRIRPIGDVDEDLIALSSPTMPGDDLLDPAISPSGREFLLLGLITDWAEANMHETLAQDLCQSAAHRVGFAESLVRLIDKIETEGTNLLELAALYDIDLAIHRQALIGLLGAIRENYPRRLRELALMDPTARRNALIRHQARLLQDAPPEFPVIGAGSTGSIPATAELLGVIARLERGAVILPGLDVDMDRSSWEALGPQHPQYGLKQLLDLIGADRGEVEDLPDLQPNVRGRARSWFASEIMRPAETAFLWRESITAHRERLALAIDGMTLCSLRSRREEATAIALILREALEIEGRTATLITPDRDLARRVSVELHRWNIAAYDSAGELLSRTMLGKLASLLIDAALNDFDAISLAALLHHPHLRLSPDGSAAALHHLELVVLRSPLPPQGLGRLARAAQEARQEASSSDYVHPAIKRLTSVDWDAVEVLAASLQTALSPLVTAMSFGTKATFQTHLNALLAALKRIAGLPDDGAIESLCGSDGEAPARMFSTMMQEAYLHPRCDFAEAMLLVSRQLSATAVRARNPESTRISILGLLEARLLRSDIVILGGLNEGKWPAQPDPGPWVNRPMRKALSMQMPERDIGLTAHDFVQALGAERVYITWSERMEGAPAVPSRWVVTARMLIAAAGLEGRETQSPIAQWVSAIDAPDAVQPIHKPKPMPPIAARPKRFSVTEVERLIRDPYAIYAKKVLRLEPLPELGVLTRHAMRGSLIHDALDLYNKLRHEPGKAALEALIEAGRSVFAAYGDDPEIVSFWWPRYERLATWFADEDTALMQGVATSLTEKRGAITFQVASETHGLSARADRIDFFETGTARIIDYKTGAVPSPNQVESGLKPQLTLEAAILARDGFGMGRSIKTDELVYVSLSGGEPPGKIQRLNTFDVMSVAEKHLSALKLLLEDYARPEQPYLPVLAMERERDRGDFDHLSRIDEWALAGEVKA